MKQDTIDKIVTRLDHLSPEELRSVFMRLVSDKGLLQDVFDALRDGIILFDAGGQARFANKAAASIYARPLRELLRTPFETLTGGTCHWDELCNSGIAITRDLQVNYPEPRHYHFHMSPIAGGSEYLLLVRDDTEQHTRGLEDAEAEQMNLLSFMASAVAHEIGNPLNSLGLNLQLLQRKLAKLPEADQAKLTPLLETAMGEAKRLDTLLHQFLHSMRPTRLQRETVNLNSLIERVLETLDPEIAPRGISVHLELSEALPELSADSAQLFQALYNLIRNAYQSIPGEDGGIYIQTAYNDNDLRIVISDTGTGISHEVMGSMYEPFRTTKSKGNGLGLLIVRRIIKDHGGTLGFASKEGTGTTVTITLPRADRVVRLLPA
ncbi:MAG: PAS domain-containing protein [Akkermansia sp.]|nr:PAS domain-containing protein [Akkermansia sp.]MBQ8377248.1 PAS domain-containing protein [Akkermansia sp.]